MQTKLGEKLRQIRVSLICVFLPSGGGTASAAFSTVASTLAAGTRIFCCLDAVTRAKTEESTADVAQTSH